MRRIILIVFIFILCGCTAKTSGSVIEEVNIKHTEEAGYGENMTVSRALASKMVCLMFFEEEKCSKIHFTDVEEDSWFFDYANIMYEKSIMVGSDGCFYPYEPVTYLEAMKIIKRLGGKDVEYENKKGNENVSYGLWLEMTEELADKKGEKPELMEIEIISLGNGEDMELMKAKTDKGVFDYSGLWLESSVGKKAKAYVKDEHIIAIKNIE